MSEFDEYKRLGEPEKKEKSEIWQTAIGLQKVDGLTPSAYLIETARSNIEGDITFDEVKTRLASYYQAKPLSSDTDDRTEEADKVSAHIAEILSEKTFSFTPVEYINIHKRLFSGIYKFAGKIRDYNIAKAEWVLGGESVLYASAGNIRATLDYDFNQEKAFLYKGMDKKQIVEHIAKFISGLWQIHAFGEGNTRTTAVFAIKYLRTFGFNVSNDLFAEHSWYFRNALVRANYNDYNRNIFATYEYLDRFFGNLLLGENNSLRNRELLIFNDNKIDTNIIRNTLNDIDDTVNVEDNTTIGENDTVNIKNDTVNDIVDTVKHENDTVFSLILGNPNITASGIAERLGIGIATAKRRIKALKDNGIIKRVGSDKTGSWQVLKNENINTKYMR